MMQFKLINSTGAAFDLTRPDAFFYAPSGLGWGETPQLQKVGAAYVLTRTDPIRPAPEGRILFKSVRQYDEFAAFLQTGGLVFCYKPLDVWRYLDVTVSLEPGEDSTSAGRLLYNVTFTGLSQWYEQARFYRSAAAEGQGKRYSYAYPYTYADGESGSVVVYNGQLSSYPKLTIVGPATNPRWYLYQGDERLASGAVTLTLQADRKLVIDCHPATMELAEYTADGSFVADRYGTSDFTTERFFELPPGQCSVQFAHDGAAAITGYVEVRRRV